MLRIWHNPRCSKSRAVLDILQGKHVEFEVLNYLIRPLDAEDLRGLVRKSGEQLRSFVRTKEPEYRVTGLHDHSPEDALMRALLAYPILIERPIAETVDRAIICRPPERVLEML
ncbi:MAG: arsenate reductase (glutaredoxin) [Pseudomonadota bacterium]